MLKLIFILGLLSLTAANLLHVPVFKDELVLTTENFHKLQQKLLKRYDENGNVESIANEITAFYGYIGIGNPVQTLKVAFDVGSTNFWLYTSAACKNYACTGYNVNSSSTFIDYGELYSYSDGYGILEGVDNIQIGNSFISSVPFEVIQTITNDQYDGVFGLGYSSGGYSYGEYGTLNFPPIYYLLNQGVISQPIYSLYLPNTKTSYGGEIIFGGSDASLYTGQLAYLPSNSTSSWVVTLDQAVLGNKVLANNMQATLDTTTPFICVPIEVLVQLNIEFGSVLGNDGAYSVPCNSISKFPNAHITVAGIEVILTPNDYIYHLQNANGQVTCELAFSYAGPYWVLGLPYMRKIYAEFNVKSNVVGIAPSVAASPDAVAPKGLPPITTPPKKPCASTLMAFMRKFQKAKFSNQLN